MTSAAEFSDSPRDLADREQGSAASDAVADAVTTQDAQDDAGESGANTPRVGVIYNPRSHRNKGKDLDASPAPHVFVAQPGARDQLPAALERFKRRGVDLLVINGGDGTVRDVLTCGYRVFGENWPTIAVLPKGKTNALTVDLDAPGDWSLQDAIDAYGDGRRIWRQPLKISALDREDPALLGFIFGAGAYATGINAGQEAHKLGAFNSLAVGLTTVWGVISALLGSRGNRWRRGARMTIRLDELREPLPHSGHGDPQWRQLLIVSTLQRFPMGIKPFGESEAPLKLAVLDQAKRRTLLLLPMVLFGYRPARMEERGLHQRGATLIELDLGDNFILDGESFPEGRYRIEAGPRLEFVAPR